MYLRLVLVLGVLMALLGACGDGPDQQSGGILPSAPANVPTKAPALTGQYVLPCDTSEYTRVKTGIATYEVKVTADPDGLISLNGVLLDVCTGVKGDQLLKAAQALSDGMLTWMGETYPQGSTEISQTVFEAKVCTEIARLIKSVSDLSRVSWVGPATNGTWDMSKMKPPKPIVGKVEPPSCPIPMPGPTA